MKFLSTLAVLMLLVSLPAIAAETAPEVPNPVVEEAPVTSMEQTEAAAETILEEILDDSLPRACLPGEPNYCENDGDCDPGCYCVLFCCGD
jgi:hypothetical protein